MCRGKGESRESKFKQVNAVKIVYPALTNIIVTALVALTPSGVSLRLQKNPL